MKSGNSEQLYEVAARVYEEESLREAARLDERERREDIEEEKDERKQFWTGVRAAIFIGCAGVIAYYIFFTG
ncbi:hypothetical protein [Numidum massiliense]|uniref:hypothetical protein n=1 Tax=Numidum massiliense TaxID=1522315 RepID=UPI0006D545D2|nr:hypothetical protein [Numidum massiliense]